MLLKNEAAKMKTQLNPSTKIVSSLSDETISQDSSLMKHFVGQNSLEHCITFSIVSVHLIKYVTGIQMDRLKIRLTVMDRRPNAQQKKCCMCVF